MYYIEGSGIGSLSTLSFVAYIYMYSDYSTSLVNKKFKILNNFNYYLLRRKQNLNRLAYSAISLSKL